MKPSYIPDAITVTVTKDGYQVSLVQLRENEKAYLASLDKAVRYETYHRAQARSVEPGHEDISLAASMEYMTNFYIDQLITLRVRLLDASDTGHVDMDENLCARVFRNLDPNFPA